METLISIVVTTNRTLKTSHFMFSYMLRKKIYNNNDIIMISNNDIRYHLV